MTINSITEQNNTLVLYCMIFMIYTVFLLLL